MTNSSLIVCPLCPLACDDVKIDSLGALVANECPIVETFRFSEKRGEFLTSPFADEVEPLRVVTTGVDLVAARNLIRLEELGKIKLTIESDPSIEAMLQTISRDGIVSATLAEVAARSDAVWLLGDVESAWPRLSSVVRLNRIDGDVVHRQSKVSAEQLAEMFSSMETSWGDSKYASVLIGPNAFVSGEESISSAFVARAVRLRNQTSRCVCVTLDSAATLRSVHLWNHNRLPESVSCDHFDIRIGTPMNGESVSAKLQIGGQDLGDSHAECYLPTAIAGIHCRSMVVRGDGSVSLPLSASVRSDQPSIVDTLNQILGMEPAVV